MLEYLVLHNIGDIKKKRNGSLQFPSETFYENTVSYIKVIKD